MQIELFDEETRAMGTKPKDESIVEAVFCCGVGKHTPYNSEDAFRTAHPDATGLDKVPGGEDGEAG